MKHHATKKKNPLETAHYIFYHQKHLVTLLKLWNSNETEMNSTDFLNLETTFVSILASTSFSQHW